MSQSGFNPRSTQILVSTLGGAFVVTLLAYLFLSESVNESPLTNSFSKSSIGHELFVETLKELGYDVRINRRSRPGKDIDGQLVIFAEPDFNRLPEKEELQALIARAGAVLLVLPKRSGVKDPRSEQLLLRVEEASNRKNTFLAFMPGGSVITVGDSAEPDWQENSLGIEPTIANVNLAVNEDLHPLIATKNGTLFGRDLFYHENLFVLSDPDIIATHGFIQGQNAELAIQIIHDILPEGGAIVFDEASHGFAVSGSFWQEMFRYPLSLLTAHLIFVILILLWVTSRRLGKTITSPPAFPPGKQFLLENVVGLMSYYRHDGFMADRYMRNLMRSTARKLRIKGSVDEIEKRLETISQAREIEYDPVGWRRALKAAGRSPAKRQKSILRTVKQAHRWKKEMLDES
ncbi:MAG: hypothetical protein ACI97A_004237 [Planctomycetota bacterium]|jgi:hypothetical protein